MGVRALRADAVASVAQILTAARRVLSKDASATLSAVAREAGVGVATLYRHFPNRVSLTSAVYERLFTSEIEPLLLDLSKGDATHEALLNVTEQIVDVVRRERTLVTTVDALGDVTAMLLSRNREVFDDFLVRAQEAGHLDPGLEGADLPQLLAVFAIGGTALDDDPAVRRRYLGVLLRGLSPSSGA